MPELPEVETVVRRLSTVLPGKTIQSTVIRMEKSFAGSPEDLKGKKIVAVTRKAKLIRIHLENSTSLLVHLKMTGQLLYTDNTVRLGGGHPTADWINALPSAHTRVWFELDNNARLFFNDQRIFGWVKHLSEEDVFSEFSNYAPDVIDEEITTDYFWHHVKKTTRVIKTVLLDSKVMSGLGNIYVCDALNVAQISPYRKAHTLSKAEAQRLLEAAKDVLHKGIMLGGATIEHFRHVDGFSGNYQKEVVVYGREGEPCFNCGATILKEKIAGRGTYFCPECQI